MMGHLHLAVMKFHSTFTSILRIVRIQNIVNTVLVVAEAVRLDRLFHLSLEKQI